MTLAWEAWPGSNRAGLARTRVMTGLVLNWMSIWALPSPPAAASTLICTVSEADACCESVTVRVSETMPGVVGAVQLVPSAAGSARVPVLALQDTVSVSPGLGSWAAAVSWTVPPAVTVRGEATRESMTGASLV